MQQNAANRRDVRAAEKAAKLAAQQRREVLVALCSSQPGRVYLWDRLEQSHVFSSTYDDNPQRMAFNEGQRVIGLALLADIIEAAPEAFIEMMREANERNTAEKAKETEQQQQEVEEEVEDVSETI